MAVASSSRWTDAGLVLPDDIRTCFTEEPRPELIRLEVGTVIYRLTTNSRDEKLRLLDPMDSAEGAWWFPKDTYEAILGLANKARGNITGAARVGLAIARRFSPELDMLSAVTLLCPGYAYRGQASRQPIAEGATHNLPGGMVQLWIPGLTRRDVRFKFFGSVTDRMEINA